MSETSSANRCAAKWAVVVQDSLLLGATVRENNAYRQTQCDPKEIELAAAQARAHDFIIGSVPNRKR